MLYTKKLKSEQLLNQKIVANLKSFYIITYKVIYLAP